jgi:tetratricopeptide (TPR) repeat protein
MSEQDFHGAHSHFQRVIDVRPTDHVALLLRGAASLRTGQLDLAYRDLIAVAKRAPTAISEAERGYWICLASRRFEVAVGHFERALHLGLDTPGIRNNTGYCYYRLSRFAEAEPYLTAALSMDPSNPTFRLNRAWLEYRVALQESRAPDLALFRPLTRSGGSPELVALRACAVALAERHGMVGDDDVQQALDEAYSVGVPVGRLSEVLQLSSGKTARPDDVLVSAAATQGPMGDLPRLADPLPDYLPELAERPASWR